MTRETYDYINYDYFTIITPVFRLIISGSASLFSISKRSVHMFLRVGRHSFESLNKAYFERALFEQRESYGSAGPRFL